MPIRMEPKAADRQVAAVTAGKRHAGGGENGRIDEHDVGHGEKRRDSGKDLGAPVGAQMREFKIAFKKRAHESATRRPHMHRVAK